MVHLCKYMPPPKDARRQIPDPANEPDFHAISALYPIPSIDGKIVAATPTRKDPPQSPSLPNISAAVASSSSTATTTCATLPPTALLSASANGIGAGAASQPKNVMDRNEALEEIKRLRARLASEMGVGVGGVASLMPPPAKRPLIHASGTLGQGSASLSTRMPQFFPTRGVSQVEAMLQRNAIIAAIRKRQQEEENALQQLQELQMHQKLKELRAAQRLEQLHELQAEKALVELRARQAVSELQQQQRHSLTPGSIGELEQAKKVAQHQQQLQMLRNQLAMQGLHREQQHQQPSSSVAQSGGNNNNSTTSSSSLSSSPLSEFLRLQRPM
jgi:hypothetical protein